MLISHQLKLLRHLSPAGGAADYQRLGSARLHVGLVDQVPDPESRLLVSWRLRSPLHFSLQCALKMHGTRNPKHPQTWRPFGFQLAASCKHQEVHGLQEGHGLAAVHELPAVHVRRLLVVQLFR